MTARVTSTEYQVVSYPYTPQDIKNAIQEAGLEEYVPTPNLTPAGRRREVETYVARFPNTRIQRPGHLVAACLAMARIGSIHEIPFVEIMRKLSPRALPVTTKLLGLTGLAIEYAENYSKVTSPDYLDGRSRGNIGAEITDREGNVLVVAGNTEFARLNAVHGILPALQVTQRVLSSPVQTFYQQNPLLQFDGALSHSMYYWQAMERVKADPTVQAERAVVFLMGKTAFEFSSANLDLTVEPIPSGARAQQKVA